MEVDHLAAGVRQKADEAERLDRPQQRRHHYETVLAPDAVYIAEDGAVIAGKERVLRHFTHIFSATPPRQLEVADVVTGAKGDVAWARLRWTLKIGEEVRRGLGTTLFTRADASAPWKVVQIQNTPDGHGSAGHH